MTDGLIRDSFIKTREDQDYTITTIETYKRLSKKYGYSARISDIFSLLRDAFPGDDIDIWGIRDRETELVSWLIDKYRLWLSGGPIDFIEVYKALELVGDFSELDKKVFHDGLVEERLWAIFMVIDNPEKQF